MRGIDVSYHNGAIDWQAVVDARYEFVIVRLGYGNRHLDARFLKNVGGARATGLKVGVYYYSYALTVEEARGEAQFVKEILEDNQITLEMGVWYDMEDADGYKQRNGMPSPQIITDMCCTFISELQAAGYCVGLYASYWWLTDIIDVEKLGGAPIWNAQWSKQNDYPSAKMWQFTDKLNIGGNLFDGNEYYG